MVSGEQQGWVGYPVDIANDTAVLVQDTDYAAPDLQVPLKYLLPAYRPGDHIKFRWANLHGFVSSVNENLETVSFVERGLQQEVSDHPRYDG